MGEYVKIFLLFGRAQEADIFHLLSDQEILQLAQQGKKIEELSVIALCIMWD